MRNPFLFRMWLLLGVFLLMAPSSAEAQSRGTKKSAARKTATKQPTIKRTHNSPTPVGDSERTIEDLLFYPFSCLNSTMSSVETVRQEIIDAFGTCESVNLLPGLHFGDAFDFTYRGVPIGVCYYDWTYDRCWYDFYFDTKAEAVSFQLNLSNDIRGIGIPLINDKIYGGFSNRTHPVSIFKWVSVADPEKVTEVNGSNIETPDVVGKYKVELAVYKK